MKKILVLGILAVAFLFSTEAQACTGVDCLANASAMANQFMETRDFGMPGNVSIMDTSSQVFGGSAMSNCLPATFQVSQQQTAQHSAGGLSTNGQAQAIGSERQFQWADGIAVNGAVNVDGGQSQGGFLNLSNQPNMAISSLSGNQGGALFGQVGRNAGLMVGQAQFRDISFTNSESGSDGYSSQYGSLSQAMEQGVTAPPSRHVRDFSVQSLQQADAMVQTSRGTGQGAIPGYNGVASMMSQNLASGLQANGPTGGSLAQVLTTGYEVLSYGPSSMIKQSGFATTSTAAAGGQR